MTLDKHRVWIPQAIAILLLLIALRLDNPPGYYIFLRWVVFGVFGYLTFLEMKEKMLGWAWTAGIIALMYNPVFLVTLGREIWTVVNITVVLIGIVSMLGMARGVEDPQDNRVA